VEHITSVCPIFAREQFIKRYDRVCAQLHFVIRNEIAVKLDKKHCYDHVLKSVETSREGKIAILWNQQVQTDRTITNNKLDIIIRDNKQGTCMFIGAAIPRDRNVIKREAENILKYKDLIIEAQVILVIMGMTGTISSSLRQYLSDILGKNKLRHCKKTAILGTADTLQKVLL